MSSNRSRSALNAQNALCHADRWRDYAPQSYPLPHPSWRNTGWVKKIPWFEADLLPDLRARVNEVLK